MMSHDGTQVMGMVGSVGSSDIFIIQELLPHMQPCTDWPSKESWVMGWSLSSRLLQKSECSPQQKLLRDSDPSHVLSVLLLSSQTRVTVLMFSGNYRLGCGVISKKPF